MLFKTVAGWILYHIPFGVRIEDFFNREQIRERMEAKIKELATG